MKNINETWKKTCIAIDIESLSDILNKLFADVVTVEIVEGELFVSFENYKPEFWYDEVVLKLSEYFDVEVTSIHVDQWEIPLVWICYKS